MTVAWRSGGTTVATFSSAVPPRIALRAGRNATDPPLMTLMRYRLLDRDDDHGRR
jgi:hypothetical protein